MTYLNDSSEVMSLIHQICDVRYSDLEQERACCEQLLKVGKRSDDPYAICYAHTYLGDYHYASGNFIESEQHLIQARQICAIHDFPDLLLDNHMFSGHLFRRIGNEQRALDYYLDGISLAEKLEHNALACTLYNSIAVIFHSLGDFTEAMNCLETAYALRDDIDLDDTELRRHINLLSNLSEVACQIGQYEKAKNYLREAEALIHHSQIDIREFGIIYIAKVSSVEVNQPQALQAVLEELFALRPEDWEDKSLAFDTLISIAQRLLEIKEYACLQQVLDTLTRACAGTEYAHSLMLHSLHIKLWRDTHTEETQTEIYQSFYNAYTYGDAISKEVRTAGLMAKMNLRRTLEEKEATQARNKVLEAVAYYDELTQAYNRRYFSDFLARMPQTDAPRQVCIAMIDLDYFKEYNDSYGHVSGDHALRTVARCLLHNASESTFVVRYGGDEFLAVCFDMTEEEAARYLQTVCDDLAAQALEHKNSGCPSKILSLSIGYAGAVVQDVAELKVLLENADRALYISKYKGRNTITRLNEP